MKRMIRAGFFLSCMLFLWFSAEITARAETIYNSPYVTFSPDGRAWTTNADDRNVVWYRADGSDDVYTGLPSQLSSLNTGEHYYDVHRRGSVPIGYWKVVRSAVNCCHMDYPGEYHGIAFEREPCLKPHFSDRKSVV